jgi:hypothetical protein
MFIVYQGEYSHLIIDPYRNELSGSTSAVVITSASANIMGSTIYLSGHNWQDNFNSNTFSATSQLSYNLNIIDSVMVNFQKETSAYFSAANVTMYHNTVNLSRNILSADFNPIMASNQFSWNPPTNYPFTPDNILYAKDINYILNHKTQLKPFANISAPPNPGFYYDTYPNYETGLFGYSRKNYVTSGI